MWLGVCGGIPRPPKNPSERKKEGGERIQSWVPSKLVEPDEMLKGDLQWIRIPSGGVTPWSNTPCYFIHVQGVLGYSGWMGHLIQGQAKSHTYMLTNIHAAIIWVIKPTTFL